MLTFTLTEEQAERLVDILDDTEDEDLLDAVLKAIPVPAPEPLGCPWNLNDFCRTVFDGSNVMYVSITHADSAEWIERVKFNKSWIRLDKQDSNFAVLNWYQTNRWENPWGYWNPATNEWRQTAA